MSLNVTFERLALIQVLLAIAAFCIATDNPGLLLIAGAIGAASWHITRGPRGRTLPPLWLNIGAALALLCMAFLASRPHGNILVAMGHFTLQLQLLLLFSKKNSREYVQLLLISALQLIGASVLSVSMIYAFILLAYCVLGMATLILFHFRAVDERVTAEHLASGDSAWPPPPPRFHNHAGQRARQSLRRLGLTGMALASLAALAVFIATPRNGSSRLNPAFGRNIDIGGPSQTGFSSEVQLGNGPLGSGSQEPVLHLRVSQGVLNLGSPNTPWLIRGMALDRYHTTEHRWSRSYFASRYSQPLSSPHHFPETPDTFKDHQYFTAQFTVRRGSPHVVFGLVSSPVKRGGPGFQPWKFTGPSMPNISFSGVDQQIYSQTAVPGGASYQLECPSPTLYYHARNGSRASPLSLSEWLIQSRRPAATLFPGFYDAPKSNHDRPPNAYDSITQSNYARIWSPQSEQVRKAAQNILKQAKLSRDPQKQHTDHDARVVSALAEHLRLNYTYSLDNPPPPAGVDPVVRFLFDTQRGHCELFAAGLVALCRSVGIPARMVVGFRASEYSELGGYYVVRQAHAHAWIEIDAGPGIGWLTFDATPAAPVAAMHERHAGFFPALLRSWEYLEFNWLRRVVGFDRQTRSAVLKWTRKQLNHFKAWMVATLHPTHGSLWHPFNPLALLAVTITGGLIFLAITRRRKRRRKPTHSTPLASSTPTADLAFYHRMSTTLAQHGHLRLPGQTPRHFAHQLTQNHPTLFSATPAIVDAYYAVRFGNTSLSDTDRVALDKQVATLEQALTTLGEGAEETKG